MAKSTNLSIPNKGLYLDRPPMAVPDGALVDCRNVRIINGRISASNLGWEKFITRQLNGPVLLIDNFFRRDGSQFLIFGTDKDLYRYDEGTGDVVFITPSYSTGTLSVNNGSASVTGSGTSWSTKAKAGDQISFGSNAQADPDATWYEIDTVGGDTAITLATNYSGSSLSGANYTIRRTFTGDDQDIWSTETFPRALPDNEDKWYATNGIDAIVEWNGDDAFVTLRDDVDLKAKHLVRYKNRLIAVNITYGGENRPYSMRASATGTPMDMTGTDAAEFPVYDRSDPLLAGYTLGDNLVLYGKRAIALSQFVGGDVRFAFRTAIDGMGPVSARAVADFGSYHELIGADGGYRFDGVSLTETGSQVWREVLREQSPQRITKAFCHFDEEHGDLIWIVPLNTDQDTEGGSPETAYVEHYLEDVGDTVPTPFTARDCPFTASGSFERKSTLRFSDLTQAWKEYNFRWNDQFFQAAFPFNLFGDGTGYIYTLNTVESADGADLEHWARFGRRGSGKTVQNIMVKRVYPFAERRPDATIPLKVRLYGGRHPSGDLILLSENDYDLTQSDDEGHFVSPFVVGRFFEAEFYSSGQPWDLDGYDHDIVPAGQR